MKKAIKIPLLLVSIYLAIVIVLELVVVTMGQSHAERGVAENEEWITITTTDASGAARDSVVAGVEIEGKLYVAANHWPRAWFNRAVSSPDVLVSIDGIQRRYHAETPGTQERDRVRQAYPMPWVIRLLTGFPPRAFLRLDPSEP